MISLNGVYSIKIVSCAHYVNSLQAKQKEIAESEKEVSNRIRNLYKKEYAKKQSRQVRLCTKTPPSSKKRFWGGN
ncbi:uncharacterized protein DS421_16g545220 [Arachis hypogaea]|nr:uncharacterized protein DS421_16g545220 [Arachis hypogaea]